MTQRADFIIPECYIDTNIVETLVCANGCNHQKGCNQVTKVMQEKFADRFAVGIIDADKRQPSYVKEFIEVCSSQHISLFRHPVRAHFIILVKPAAESFILSCAKTAHINLADYKLSSALSELMVQTKNVMSNRDARFKSLFKAMENLGEMKRMKALISYLADARYNCQNERLVAIFSE